jgi:hypothetical protein
MVEHTMSPFAEESSGRDERVNAAIAEFLEEVEAGRAPDRHLVSWNKPGAHPPALPYSKMRLWTAAVLAAAKARKLRKLTPQERERFELEDVQPDADR